MKTRVIKYWADTAWLFAVQAHECAKEDTSLYSYPYGKSISTWKKGEWRWNTKHSKLDFYTAERIAIDMARKPGAAVDTTMVVREYGSDRSQQDELERG